ncbi:MAG: hypothetical protein JNJ57_21280, partial [Saprospiraceae bacterium]|nr:hypothetical protein [Saprospiraceae bacterium]
AYYADINASGTASTDNKYQENLTYADARGNIASITRNGLYKTTSGATCWTLGQIDNLAYTYTSGTNRLQKIADTAPTGGAGNPQRNSGFNPGSAGSTATYGYDANGNMTSDPYKAITLTYNHLNLPTQFNFGAGKTIDILYDHAGKKLRKTVKPTTSSTDYTQDYVKGLEYRTIGSGGTLTLEAIYTDEGRITPNGAAYRYEYTIKDHLGNARISFADLNANNVVDVPSDVLQENHYYPFGMNMSYTWLDETTLIDNRYQFSNRELHNDYQLNLAHHGARWYDAAIGRWSSVDKFSPFAPDWNPYRYGFDNPTLYIDPEGLFESKKEAKAYARANGIKTGIFKKHKIAKQSDGTFAIENKKDGYSISQDKSLASESNPDGITKSALIIGESKQTEANRTSMQRADGAANTVGLIADNFENAIVYTRTLGKAAESLTEASVLKGIKALGKLSGVTSAVVSGYQFLKDPTLGNFLKAAVNVGLVFTGPTVGLIVGTLDMMGVTDAIYDQFTDLKIPKELSGTGSMLGIGF